MVEQALNLLLILHADHEQNCSTSTVRMVGSSQANLFASIAAGICALWGPLHGGANQAVIEMLETIRARRRQLQEVRRPGEGQGLGLPPDGLRPPRLQELRSARRASSRRSADDVLAKLGINDPLLDIAKQLEEVALNDEYFIERKLYPNVDFYSGIIYRAIGIPTNMFTVHVRPRPPARLDRPLEGDAGRPRDPHQPPAPDLHRRQPQRPYLRQ